MYEETAKYELINFTGYSSSWLLFFLIKHLLTIQMRYTLDIFFFLKNRIIVEIINSDNWKIIAAKKLEKVMSKNRTFSVFLLGSIVVVLLKMSIKKWIFNVLKSTDLVFN